MQREHNEHKISKACQLIGGSNDIHYDMKEAAAAVNMGYESFRKLFKATTGLSPQRYHIEQLMKQAKMMLLSGLPIKHVAEWRQPCIPDCIVFLTSSYQA